MVDNSNFLSPREEAKLRTGEIFFEAFERSKPPCRQEKAALKEGGHYYWIGDSNDDIVGKANVELDARIIVEMLNTFKPSTALSKPEEPVEYFELVDADGKSYEGLDRQIVDYSKTYTLDLYGQEAHTRGLLLAFYDSEAAVKPTRISVIEVEPWQLFDASTIKGRSFSIKLNKPSL